MSNEDKKTATDKKFEQVKEKGIGDIPRGIPVAFARFAKPLQVPGHQSADGVRSEKLANEREWIVEYIPQIRHHKITYLDPARSKEPKVGFVHETHVVAWEPL